MDNKERLESVVREIWNEMPGLVEVGVITYERQLQAELYHQFKLRFPSQTNYQMWVEPVFYMNKTHEKTQTIKPDLVITNSKKFIVAVIELKFMPWGYPKYEGDIAKLNRLQRLSKTGKSFSLGFVPVSHVWQTQEKEKDKILDFQLSPNLQTFYCLFGKPDSNIIENPASVKGMKQHILLSGFINSEGKIEIKK